MAKLAEIKDGNFPLLCGDDYEYEPPSIGTSFGSNSLKAFEKDKTAISAIRVKAVLKDADDHLAQYLSRDDTKLILAGTQKVVSAFLGLTRFSKHIIGKVQGSFTEKNVPALENLAWLTLVRNRKTEDEQYVHELIEKSNKNLAEGIQAAWNTAQEGKGLLLAVEKDFRCQAYQKPNDYKLLLQPPRKPYTIIPDAVDDLIETVSKKGGKIMFLENDQLKKLGHLALVLRY
jgi:hypothetical protein